MIQIAEHPLLDAGCIQSTLPLRLGQLSSPEFLTDKLSLEAESPINNSEEVKTAVRQLLRHGGYQPSGRGKPSSEYLKKVAGDGQLKSINPAVDVCNVVSLHSGLPISVIDLEKTDEPLSISIGGETESYVFNPSGQTISLRGLLCLYDRNGPCGNGVKDSQRTKTDGNTVRTLSIIWGTRALPGRTEAAINWYRKLLDRLGADSELVATRTVTPD